MPTYTYRCKACAHQFNQFQKFSDDPLTVCPECGGEIYRVIQPVGVVFKGSGWYITDHRKPESSETSTSHVGTKTNGAKSADSNGKTSDSDSKKPATSDSTTSTSSVTT